MSDNEFNKIKARHNACNTYGSELDASLTHRDRAWLINKIEELEAWAIARCNELGTQITRRDKRIKELEAKLNAYETIIIEMGEDTSLGSAAAVNVVKRVALEYYDRLEEIRETENELTTPEK